MKGIDFYIKESDVNENGIMEVEIAADLLRRNREANMGYYQPIVTSEKEEMNAALKNSVSLPSVATVTQEAPIYKTRINPATNWWLALIAFLLFLILCNMGD